MLRWCTLPQPPKALVPFPLCQQVLDLLPLADSVTKLSARCKFCAQEQRRTAAVFSLRIAADSRQELVGGADVYAPVCRRHYVQLTSVRQHGGAESDGGAGGAA